ncbi:Membrane protein involved in colicin uptake [Vogesella sp. LIG4]|nr:Membrane protein involved in colicin uptake [Vogesella sp. LIG4]
MRYLILALSLLFYPASSLYAQVTIGIGVALPGIDIGINLPIYPSLVRVPGYPVYYAPQVDVNLFFYDGLYWAYEDDRWYAASWYNGPWDEVEPEYVPLFILRIPVRYYRRPPAYFRDWREDRPPRWGEHWGPGWERRHRGWERWNLSSAPPAPLPNYQRNYSGSRYPGSVEQQNTIRSQSYRYQPRETVIPQRFQPRNQQQQEPSHPQWQRQQVPPWQQQQREAPQQQPQQRQQPQEQQWQQRQQPQWQQQQRQAPQQRQQPQEPQWQQRQQPQWQQQQRQAPQQQQQPQEPQWQQRQQPQQGERQGRPRPDQYQQQPDTQGAPTQRQQEMQPRRHPPNMWPPETDQ